MLRHLGGKSSQIWVSLKGIQNPKRFVCVNQKIMELEHRRKTSTFESQRGEEDPKQLTTNNGNKHSPSQNINKDMAKNMIVGDQSHGVAGKDYFSSLVHNKESNTTQYSGVVSTNIPDALPLKPFQPFPKPSYNLAAYVRHSEVLTNLVKLGINLSELEKKSDVSWLLKLKFDHDVKPYLIFLQSIGVPGDIIGPYLTKNIYILQESLDDLHVRVNYLKSKKIEDTCRLITKCPVLLCMSTQKIDDRLGYLQSEFKLSGAEVRLVVTRLPKIISWPLHFIRDVCAELTEFLGFSKSELKLLLIAQPKVYLTSKYHLKKRFDYVHNEMGITHQQILQWPDVLRSRMHVIRQRHEFLKHIGRDQYDVTKENYVSLRALVSKRDIEFCEKVAKVTTNQYNEYLKTM